MFRKTFIVILALLFAVTAFAKPAPVVQNFDAAPGLVPGPALQTDPQWDLQYEFNAEGPSGDNGCLGIAYDGTYAWVSGRGVAPNPNMIYLFDPISGAVMDQFPSGSASSWGCRDLCFDGTFMYSGWEQGMIQWNITTHAVITTIPFPGGMSFQRANAYDPATDHFYGGNFGSTCYEQDRSGTLIRSWSPAPLTAVYGMAWDDDDPAGDFLWVHDQGDGCFAHQLDPVTLTYTGVISGNLQPPIVGNAVGYLYALAGGLDYCQGIDPQYSSLLSFCQGTPDGAGIWEMHLMASLGAPGAPTSFVIANNGTALIASLSWTNPSVTVGGATLTELTGIKVYRDGGLIATLTGMVPGAAASYDDLDILVEGLYGYAVKGYNSEGDGIPVSGSAWIGLDVPEAPGNVTVTPVVDDDAEITWDSPTAGANGGYWPAGSWDGQYVYRNANLIATLTGTNNSYTDTPPFAGTYTYSVSYYNPSGEGPQGYAPPTYIPGPPQYTASVIPYDWVDISGTGTNTGITGDDQNGGPYPIGFDFPYYSGVLHNSIRVCSNGWASFTSTATTYVNPPIPTAAEPNNLLAGYFDDLHAGQGGIWYQTLVDDRFIVQFDSIRRYSGGGYYTYQIILYPDGVIEYMYKYLNPGTSSNSPTVGIEDDDGSEGIQCDYNGSGPIIAQERMGIRIGPPVAHDVEVVLTPVGTIQIPAGGGTFDFNIAVTNNEANPLTFEVWTMITLPNTHHYGPVIGPVGVTVAGGASIDRDRTQAVPGHAPTGDYTYDAYVGTYPGDIWDDDFFPFEKLAISDGGPFVSEWASWGESFEDPVSESSILPQEFALHNAYPNPFNPTATIAYDLKEATNVKLVVFDITGRTVATLVEGWVNEGAHYAVFTAENLSSGIYFYKLNAGSFTDTKKMLLLK